MELCNNETKFTWQDGDYTIRLEQEDNGMYSIEAKNNDTGNIDFASTDVTSSDCKKSVYDFIHG